MDKANEWLEILKEGKCLPEKDLRMLCERVSYCSIDFLSLNQTNPNDIG